MQATEIITYQPSQNTGLANVLVNLEEQFIAAARANIQASGGAYTQAELVAMEKIEALHLINGMDLAALQLRYKLIREIRDNGLFSIDPRGYNTLEEMGQAQGISISELSNIIQLNEIIFPYIENTLRVPVAQIWEQIGKSNFRELAPVLISIIRNEPSGSPAVNATVTNMLNDIAATAGAAGQQMSEDEMRQEAVEQLIELGALPNRQVRQHLRPERTPAIEATIVRSSGRTYVLAEVDSDQEQMLRRKMGAYMDPVEVSLPTDGFQRRNQARQIPVLSDLITEVQ